MKTSYFRTQWYKLLFALLCLVIACCYFFSPAIDESTLSGLSESLRNLVAGSSWFLYAVFLFVISFTSYNESCIQELNKRVNDLERRIETIESRAITDIEEESPNDYVCFRKLGPDKEEQK